MPPNVLVIVGPTASGKTKLSVELAKQFNGEIVSSDSMQIYRQMDIGTAKPSHEEMDGVPHHMIDVVDPTEDFSVARYVALAVPIIDDILSRGKLPIIAGGTGLYIDSLLSGRTFAPFVADDGLRSRLESDYNTLGGEEMLRQLSVIDPTAAARLHANDAKRVIRALEIYHGTGKTITEHDEETKKIPPRYNALTIGLNFKNKEDMWHRIDKRVDAMVAQGLIPEISALLQAGIPHDCTAMQAIGYKEFVTAITQDGDLVAAAEDVKLRSRQYAKRQLTWFKRNPTTHWILWDSLPNFGSALQNSTAYLEEFGI